MSLSGWCRFFSFDSSFVLGLILLRLAIFCCQLSLIVHCSIVAQFRLFLCRCISLWNVSQSTNLTVNFWSTSWIFCVSWNSDKMEKSTQIRTRAIPKATTWEIKQLHKYCQDFFHTFYENALLFAFQLKNLLTEIHFN